MGRKSQLWPSMAWWSSLTKLAKTKDKKGNKSYQFWNWELESGLAFLGWRARRWCNPQGSKLDEAGTEGKRERERPKLILLKVWMKGIMIGCWPFASCTQIMTRHSTEISNAISSSFPTGSSRTNTSTHRHAKFCISPLASSWLVGWYRTPCTCHR